MALFKIGKKLEYIKENPFRLEKEIQNLSEENLKTILGLDFVKSEFALNNFRIDTLAFDKEAFCQNICFSKRFVVEERSSYSLARVWYNILFFIFYSVVYFN